MYNHPSCAIISLAVSEGKTIHNHEMAPVKIPYRLLFAAHKGRKVVLVAIVAPSWRS